MSFDLRNIVLSLTVSATVLGCAAETEEPDANTPSVVAPRDPEEKTTADEKGAQQDRNNGSLGSSVRPLAAKKPPGEDTGCPDWGCGSNHNRRLVRI